MKKIIIFAACIAFALTSCTPAEKKIEESVDGFLSAYLSMDFDKASGYCTANVADAIKPALDTTGLNGTIASKIKELARTTTYEIVSIDTESEEDTAIVKYNVISESPAFVFEKSMTLKKCDGEWKIAALSM
ncbi:MAG: DUF4878 domain-containing protein [Bacteroidales bacterium]|nr:DUF4878 domain-containing protein [Bacteroidales bacterium]